MQVQSRAEQVTARAPGLNVQVTVSSHLNHRPTKPTRSTSGAVDGGGFDEQVKKMEDEFNAVSQGFLRGNLHAFRLLLLCNKLEKLYRLIETDVFSKLDELRTMQATLATLHTAQEEQR